MTGASFHDPQQPATDEFTPPEPSAERIARLARARCVEAGFEESTTPLADAWYIDHKGTDSADVLVNWPRHLWVDMSPDRVASVRIGGVTIRQPLDDMRLMLLAALEWLDVREADLA